VLHIHLLSVTLEPWIIVNHVLRVVTIIVEIVLPKFGKDALEDQRLFGEEMQSPSELVTLIHQLQLDSIPIQLRHNVHAEVLAQYHSVGSEDSELHFWLSFFEPVCNELSALLELLFYQGLAPVLLGNDIKALLPNFIPNLGLQQGFLGVHSLLQV